MKKIAVIVLVLLLAAAMILGCSSSKASSKMEGKEITFEYKAYTRGSNLSYVVTKDSVVHKEDMRGEVTTYKDKMVAEDWDVLLAATEKIDMAKLETAEVPSKKHQFDGALAATLKIMIDGKEYRTPTFDHGNPPLEVKELVTTITGL
ncbi:hypothetical protein [uncultured Flavobacterium sp.]|uniref:hypothetical protein n=1 Tax=uncultured Flavobacterium sp. TaxID=165435 RepID=UPI0025D31F16|nr:hypothetical protein [uncultured Flavobacterium sp.]